MKFKKKIRKWKWLKNVRHKSKYDLLCKMIGFIIKMMRMNILIIMMKMMILSIVMIIMMMKMMKIMIIKMLMMMT